MYLNVCLLCCHGFCSFVPMVSVVLLGSVVAIVIKSSLKLLESMLVLVLNFYFVLFCSNQRSVIFAELFGRNLQRDLMHAFGVQI